MWVLVLDDNVDRHRVYRKLHEDLGDLVTSCTHYLDFVEELSSRAWDLVYLDHDPG